MTTNQRTELEDKANSLAAEGKYSDAGDTYVRAGFEEAGQWFGSSSWGQELRMLYKACLCYRLADHNRQCRFTAKFGILLAEEYAARAERKPSPSHPPDKAERGVWYEFIGDLRLIADFDGVTEAYDRAKEIYKEVGDPLADFAEGPVMVVQAIFSTTVLIAGEEYDLISNSAQGRLTDWVEYKQEQLPKLIESILSSGEWHQPE